LQDFSTTVCMEAMAADRPVICLNLGGSAGQISQATGMKVSADNHTQSIMDMANAQISQATGMRVSADNHTQSIMDMANVMTLLVSDPQLGSRMGKASQQRVSHYYSWNYKG
jgi:glycosyltransferase involved in cell wall biosynthesis